MSRRLALRSIPETLPHWARRWLVVWGVWAAAVVGSFAAIERIGLRSRDDDAPTLTGVVSRYVPGWLWFTAAGAAEGWLGWHFKKAYESWQSKKPDYPR